VARSADTRERVRAAGGLADADAADLDSLRGAITEVREAYGRVDAIVNAVSASRPPEGGGPFGGGPLADATLAGFHGWTAAVAEQAFVFLSAGAAALRDQGRGGGTLIQVTGGSARRPSPGRGLWAAGAAATRALVHAAAQELRGEGIHVALLIVDGTIGSPKTERMTRDMAPDAVADQGEVARAAVDLAQQSPQALSHELMVTPAGDRWVP